MLIVYWPDRENRPHGSHARRSLSHSSPFRARSHLSLILIRVVLMGIRAAFLISSTPLSFLPPFLLTMSLPFFVSLSLTFAVRPDGTFATPKANLIRLGALASAPALSRTVRPSTKRVTRRSAHGAPSVQVSWTPHAERLQLPCGVGGTAKALMVVVLGSELFPGVISGSIPTTDAVLLAVPGWVGNALMVTVAEAPLARGPRWQTTGTVPSQVPWFGIASPGLPGQRPRTAARNAPPRTRRFERKRSVTTEKKSHMFTTLYALLGPFSGHALGRPRPHVRKQEHIADRARIGQ